MKKVALLTIHRIANCGSLLQTWAMFRSVERLGCACTLVDYDFPTWRHLKLADGNERKWECARFAKLKLLLHRIGLLEFARHVNFLRNRFLFRRKMKPFFAEFRMTKKCNQRTVGKVLGYDAYLTGSDQTWNPRFLGEDHTFLLDFTPDCARRISYAASFGCRALPQPYQSAYGRLLSRYAAISVREPSGVSIVRGLCGRESTVVVDPTLLMRPADYACLAGNRIPQGKRFIFCYVLSYVFDSGDWVIKLAEAVGVERNAGIIFFTDDPKMAGIARKAGFDVFFEELSVADFLEFYFKSDFVITTSFHGTAFSLNFKKNFYSIINPNASADDRVASFLKRFGLSSRGIFPGTDVIPLVRTLTVDYLKAERYLSEEREKSLDFLMKALGCERTVKENDDEKTF